MRPLSQRLSLIPFAHGLCLTHVGFPCAYGPEEGPFRGPQRRASRRADDHDLKKPIDILILSPRAGNGRPVWSLIFRKDQIKYPASVTFRAWVKKVRHDGCAGWSFTFDPTTFHWYQMDAEGDCNAWKLGEFLQDAAVLAKLTDKDLVKSITYKDARFGLNISKVQAILNSMEWKVTEPDVDPMAALDALPSATAFDTPEPEGPGGSTSSAASTTSTPEKRDSAARASSKRARRD